MSNDEATFNARCHSLLNGIETSKGEPKLTLLIQLFNYVNTHLEAIIDLSPSKWTTCAASFYYSVCRVEHHVKAHSTLTCTLLAICRDLKHSLRLYLAKLVAIRSVLLNPDNKHIARALASLNCDPDA